MADHPHESLHELYEDAPCGYLSTLPDGTIVKANQTFLSWTGYEAAELTGHKRLQDLLTLAGKVFHAVHVAPSLDMYGVVKDVALDLVSQDGKRLPCFCNATVKRDAAGRPELVRILLFDAGDRRLYEKELLAARRVAQKGRARLEYLAENDYLTALPNRHSFAIRLDEAVVRVRASGAKLAVLFVRMDRFKDVNDRWGHDMGDLVLAGLAQRFQTDVDPRHLAARLGGDEFAIVLESADTGQAMAYARKLLADIGRPFDLAGRIVSVGASIGVAVYPDAGLTGSELVRHAELAAYDARMAGGFRAVVHTGETAARHARESLLRQDLPRAVRNGDFLLHYQGKTDARTGALCGTEALLRWRHPDRATLLMPEEFLHLIKASPVRDQVFGWTINEVCRQIAAWRAQGLDLPVSVNLSAWQLNDTALSSQLLEAASIHGVPPRCVWIELTEGAVITDGTLAIQRLRELANAGFAIALDRFGAGYTDLAHLLRYPIQEIKIDRSLVSALDREPSARKLVPALITLGKTMGLRVVAEGVETAAQQRLLTDAGCDGLQGLLIAPPMSASDYLAFALRFDAGNDRQGSSAQSGS